MHTVAEALGAIERATQPLKPLHLPLAEALGHVLAEAAIADLDSPPFDKSLMDGYACRSEDLTGEPLELRVVEEVHAGALPTRPVGPGEATRIMTGAPLPAGVDVVVPVEFTRLVENSQSRVRIEMGKLHPGRNILRQGEATRKGTTVVEAGTLIRAVEVGCLAELGRHSIRVHRKPRVAVLATGNELVPITTRPGPGQIRNSNEAMLVAQLRQAGYEAFSLGIARDTREDLRSHIARGLQYDVFVLSGGVSAGQVDLVPEMLSQAGVKEVFHKVRIKPGQPLWFGRLDRDQTATAGPEGTGTASAVPESARQHSYVFGLPGNPVSSLVCCELFVKTALRRLAGLAAGTVEPIRARLTQPHRNGGNRPTYHPARLEFTPAGPTVAAVRWIGSADLSSTAQANAMAVFELPDHDYSPGELVPVYPWT